MNKVNASKGLIEHKNIRLSMKKRRKGYYSISVVAKMFSVHQQTIRLYEKEGLINPKRTEGNTRLFSEEDVDKLEEIIYLTHKLGVNLAGVEVVLSLQKKIDKLQGEINKLFKQTQKQISDEGEEFKETVKRQAKKLMEIKESASAKATADKKESTFDIKSKNKDDRSKESDPVDVEIVDDWEVDYDDKE